MFTSLDEIFNGDQRNICRILRMFLRVCKDDLARLDVAFANGDWEGVRFTAHSIKSACLQIGETTAGESLTNLELMAVSGRPVSDCELSVVKAALNNVFKRVMDHIEAHDTQAGM